MLLKSFSDGPIHGLTREEWEEFLKPRAFEFDYMPDYIYVHEDEDGNVTEHKIYFREKPGTVSRISSFEENAAWVQRIKEAKNK